ARVDRAHPLARAPRDRDRPARPARPARAGLAGRRRAQSGRACAHWSRPQCLARRVRGSARSVTTSNLLDLAAERPRASFGCSARGNLLTCLGEGTVRERQDPWSAPPRTRAGIGRRCRPPWRALDSRPVRDLEQMYARELGQPAREGADGRPRGVTATRRRTAEERDGVLSACGPGRARREPPGARPIAGDAAQGRSTVKNVALW